MSQIDAEEAVEEMKKTMRRGVDGHKHTFLHRFMDHQESVIEQKEKDRELFKMPVGLRTKPTEETKLVAKPILK